MAAQQLLAGKVALVTGGTSGIGEDTALLYAKEGAKVVITGRNEERGQKVVDKIKAANGEATFFKSDIKVKADIEATIKFVVDTYGQLDIAFNNAGISGPIKMLLDLEYEEWQDVVNTNMTSVWLFMKLEIQQMLTQGGGVIVNHASLAGIQGMPFVASYCAAKHGVIGLTKTASLEYCTSNIRVNAICPGSIDTPLLRASVPEGTPDSALYADIPMNRLGKSTEIADTVLWLSSDQSSFVSGQAISIDGAESGGRKIPSA